MGSTETITINFPKKFKTRPIVNASIGTMVDSPDGTHFITDSELLSVYIPSEVSFKVRWKNLSQSNNNGRYIQWVAFGN
ncbi:MAG: hypothetical protein ACRCXY_00740 [Fusobacteriaceae bacterium]